MVNSKARKWLANFMGTGVRFDENMCLHTSFRVGGPAEAYITPRYTEELVSLIRWARENRIEYTIVGDGTNLLVKDGGICGMVISLTKCSPSVTVVKADNEEVIISALAGTRMHTLCSFAIAHGLDGMNFALGIPGTVGGGIMMNAGTVYGAVENVLESISVLTSDGSIRHIKKESLRFDYRKLKPLPENESLIILDGNFSLRRSPNPEKLKKDAQDILNTRRKKQPVRFPSAGCFFKNPKSDEKSSVKSAGELIDRAGLKGKCVGGAEISCQHANFIINRGNASAADIINLGNIVRETVLGIYHIELEPEVRIIGTI